MLPIDGVGVWADSVHASRRCEAVAVRTGLVEWRAFFAPSPNANANANDLRQSIAARCVMGICLRGAPRQQCAEDQIGDNGFQQGAGRPLVASRHGDVTGDQDAAGQRQPKP